MLVPLVAMTRKVALFLPDAVQLSSVAAPTDLLQLANRFAHERTGQHDAMATRDARAQLACRWLSADGAAVRIASGGSQPVDGAINADEVFDAVFVCAFEAIDDASLQARLDANRPETAWLRRQHEAGAIIAASGTGVFLLAETGLLDRRPATVAWWQQRLFHRRYPQVRMAATQHITEQDNLLCADSLAGLFPLALRVARRLLSPNAADWLTKTTLIDTMPGHGPPGAMLDRPDTVEDALVATAQYHLQQRYADATQLGELSRMLSVSPRTLCRRFQRAIGMSPQAYVQTLRIEAAKRMLLRTNLHVDRIAQQVGYSDPGFFKRLFRQRTDMSPAAWRAQPNRADIIRANAAHG